MIFYIFNTLNPEYGFKANPLLIPRFAHLVSQF